MFICLIVISVKPGMALHEKAKKLLKLRDYDSCLPLLIEADICFSRCTDEILGRVDNVALCQLDIVWCYLSLRYSISIVF